MVDGVQNDYIGQDQISIMVVVEVAMDEQQQDREAKVVAVMELQVGNSAGNAGNS